MGYPEDETSVASSRPAELYTFATPVATYRYTSHDLPIVYGGQTYTPIEISRPSVTAAPTNVADFSIKLPYDAAFSLAEAYSIPSYQILFTLTRVQLNSGIGIVFQQGFVSGFSTDDVWTSVRVPSLFNDALDAPVPSIYYSGSCGHRLYDAMCQIDRTNASYNNTVTLPAFDGSRTYTASSVGGHIDHWFRSGELLVPATGERRLIFDQVGTALELNAPLKAYTAGMTVTIYAGCDHTVRGDHGCRFKFSNVTHFFGFPYITPTKNPFTGGMRVVSPSTPKFS